MRPRARLAACFPVALLALTLFSACTTTARVNEVYTALDSDGVRRRNVFFTDTIEIHCLAEVGVGRPDVTVETYIHQIRAYNFQTSTFFETDRYLGYVEIKPDVSKDRPAVIDLSLGRVDAEGKPADNAPFTAGSYICEVALDGTIEKTAPFNIDFPPCPPAFLIPGGPCFGFFTEATKCPKYGLLSDDPAECICSPTKGWICDPG